MEKAAWKHKKYKGHQLELRSSRRHEGEEPELLIDAQLIPLGRLFDGTYYIQDNAYDWDSDLSALAERFVDYRSRVEQRRRQKTGEEGAEHGPA
ncbi:hypothetical protein ASG92_25525 [Arthrobacter sp. Soil736]|uniref:hypothetical protein n=1 Tax=Arthrobacter sp. Soil736 TaxID=1736395 RepID=UPI0006F930C4|nr:hypothetical protein [Arthrobacter sp. Soil736]KRE52411.1 hypothetical protein ASG92_25525 [Arthrobacter sp. Soil736]